jgi:FlaA1/EpsC-like NDP-sugar epimerase
MRNEWIQNSGSFIFYILTKFIVFYAFGIHKGLVRYTSTQDLQRILKATLTCTLLFVVVGMFRAYVFHTTYLFPSSILVMEFIISLSFVLGSRFLIKLLYLESIKTNQEQENVLIFGAGTMGLIAKKTIENDTRNHQKVVGFLEDNPKLIGNRIDGVAVYSNAKIIETLSARKVNRVIIAIRNPNKESLKQLIDTCLTYQVKVQRVQDPITWVNGELTPQKITKIPIEDLLGRDSIRLNQDSLQVSFENTTVFISGAAGSIGAGLVQEILQYNPRTLVLFDQAESPMYELQQALKLLDFSTDVRFVIGDICDLNHVSKTFAKYKPQIVFHAAAYKHVPLMEANPKEAIQTNVIGTMNLVNASLNAEVKKFILISTDKAVNPTNIMGASKRLAEMYAQWKNTLGKTHFITTRFGNVLGSNGSVIPLFQKQIEQGGPITLTDERITRYFMTIPEACQLVLDASYMGKGGEIFVFDMGASVKILDLAKKMILLNGLELNKDIEIKITGLRPGEKLYEELLADAEQTQATHHPKILIANTRLIEPSFEMDIAELLRCLQHEDATDFVRVMKKIVPEFISQNSEFEKLDL